VSETVGEVPGEVPDSRLTVRCDRLRVERSRHPGIVTVVQGEDWDRRSQHVPPRQVLTLTDAMAAGLARLLAGLAEGEEGTT